MQTEQFRVLNVKCGGCATNIQNTLIELNGVNHVEVSIDTSNVTVQGEGLNRRQLGEKLAELGYPEA